MTLTRIHPTPSVIVDVDEAYAAPERPWLRANLIASIDGRVGDSRTLTRGDDRRVLGAIRRAADVVLVGATSLRREGYFVPRTAALAVVTTSGDLRGHAVPQDARNIIVLCPEQAVSPVRATFDVPAARIVPVGTGPLPGSALVHELRSLGYPSIVCEGGPALVAQLLDELDELCLSTAPVLLGTGSPLLSIEVGKSARLEQLLVDEVGVSYARYRLRDAAATG